MPIPGRLFSKFRLLPSTPVIRNIHTTTTMAQDAIRTSPFPPKPKSPTEASEPIWSADTEELTKARALELINRDRWALSATKMGLEREFRFKTFAKSMVFINTVADHCKAKRHHPEWANVYNRVVVRWTTHNPQGLSYRDVEMAEFCDEKAKELGEVLVEGGDAPKAKKEVGVANLVDSLLGDAVECGPCAGESKSKE